MSKAKHSHLIRMHRARRRTARKAAFVMRMRIVRLIVRLVREVPNMYRSTPRARHTRKSALSAVPAMLARWVRHCERHRIMVGDQPARWFAKEMRRYAGLS